jgi:hypothetical protein
MSEANRHIGRVLGLPALDFVDFGADLCRERPDGVHWKTAAVVEHAAGRPFIWVDDELSVLDDLYVDAHSPAPTALHHVDPRVGLRPEDFAALLDLAATLTDRAALRAAG